MYGTLKKISHHIVFGGIIKEHQALSLRQKLKLPYAFKISFVIKFCYFFCLLLFLFACVCEENDSHGKKIA